MTSRSIHIGRTCIRLLSTFPGRPTTQRTAVSSIARVLLTGLPLPGLTAQSSAAKLPRHGAAFGPLKQRSLPLTLNLKLCSSSGSRVVDFLDIKTETISARRAQSGTDQKQNGAYMVRRASRRARDAARTSDTGSTDPQECNTCGAYRGPAGFQDTKTCYT